MAVVQISRIQQRRGRKLEGTGIPQLASGELGWAIDTQELYIGNGAVSEGAPAVGNTKILTDKDDLLLLAAQYAYLRDEIQTSDNIAAPIERTIEDRLNERVSVLAFGVGKDGTGDQSDAIQRAIDELYLKDTRKGDAESRVELFFPAGTYTIGTSIKVPPYAKLVGEGKGKTFINCVATGAFVTVNGDSSPGDYRPEAESTTGNQPKNILISGMTITSDTFGGVLSLQSCADSIFQNLEFIGNWDSGFNPSGDYSAIKITSLSSVVSSNNNYFEKITTSNFTTAISSDFDIKNNIFDGLNIKNGHQGINFGVSAVIGTVGQLTGPLHNTIKNSMFENIYRTGIDITNGVYNISQNNKFFSVGNNGGSSQAAQYPIIKFGQLTNTSSNDYFERIEDLLTSTTNYIPEIQGSQSFEYKYPINISIGIRESAETLLNLPVDGPTGTFKIDYWYVAQLPSGNSVLRKGVLEVLYNTTNIQVIFNHDYIINGEDPLDGEAIIFDAGFTNTLNPDSGNIAITVQNLYPSITTDNFSFQIEQKR